jgi:hypothetical protein
MIEARDGSFCFMVLVECNFREDSLLLCTKEESVTEHFKKRKSLGQL